MVLVCFSKLLLIPEWPGHCVTELKLPYDINWSWINMVGCPMEEIIQNQKNLEPELEQNSNEVSSEIIKLSLKWEEIDLSIIS